MQKLSIRNLDVVDFMTVNGISNFRKAGGNSGSEAGNWERKVLKFFPIRKLQALNCEALSIF